jgi:acyl-activating enzyme 14
MADEIKAAGIEKFDGTDFGYWKMQIEDYLYGKKLHLPLLGSKPENMQEEDWLLLDRQVLGIIRLSLSRRVAGYFLIDKFWVLSGYPYQEELLTMLQKKDPLQD